MSNVDLLLDSAFLAYNQKEYDKAEESARQALILSPTNGDGLYLLGLIAIESNALEPAEKLLYQAVQLYPENKNYKLSLAFVLEKQGRLEEALSFYEPFKEDAFVLAQIGFVYLKKGQADFAKSAFEKALTINKGVATAYIGLALILRGQGQYEKALDCLVQGESETKTAELLYQKAVTYRLMGKFSAGLREIERALSLEKTAAFYNEKGLNEEGLNLMEGAKLSYGQALDMNAYFADAYANLGNLYLKENDFKRAEDAYKRALGVDKDFLNAHHNLALLLHKMGRLTEALEHFRSVIILNPRHQEALYNLAIILEEMGEYEEAAGLYFNLLTWQDNQEWLVLRLRIQNTLYLLAKGDKKAKKQARSFAKGWAKSFPNCLVAKVTNAALNHEKISDEEAKAYATQLYDAFANTYDEVIEKLDAKALGKIVPLLPKGVQKVLDLGCGTGSLADYLMQDVPELVGVDISKKMLDKAMEKKAYTRLVHQDVCTFLRADTDTYDAIIASDVVPYLSDLKGFLSLIHNRLNATGVLLMTVEIGDEEAGILSENGRFCYKAEWLKSCFNALGFVLKHFDEIPLRKEGDSIAKGVLILAQTNKEDCSV